MGSFSASNKKSKYNQSMKMSKSLYALAIAGACSVSVSAQTLTYSFAEVGTDVVLTVSGSLNDLTVGGSGWTTSGVPGPAYQNNAFLPADFLNGGTISVWNASDTGNVALSYVHSSLTPSTIGSSGSSFFGGSTTGDSIWFRSGASMFAIDAQIRLPSDYGTTLARPWGSSLFSTTTYTSQTLAGMGLTGSLPTYNLGNGNSIVFTASAPTPVPEASGSVAGLGLAVAGLYQLGRRRQNTVTE